MSHKYKGNEWEATDMILKTLFHSPHYFRLSFFFTVKQVGLALMLAIMTRNTIFCFYQWTIGV